MAYHNGLSQALIELFPDIRFKKENFIGKSNVTIFFLVHLFIN
jgi:hypothetical protein